jgi:hypothetical protein
MSYSVTNLRAQADEGEEWQQQDRTEMFDP